MPSLRLAAPLLAALLAACAFNTGGLGGGGTTGDIGGSSASSPAASSASSTSSSSSAASSSSASSSSASSASSAASSSTGTGGAGGCTGDPSKCMAVPAGWQRVGFAESTSTACPNGFTAQDGVESPGSAPCACGACNKQPPSCDMGPIATAYDTGSGNCEKGGPAASNGNAGMCNGTNTNFGSHFSGTAPAPTGGSCTATGTADPAQITDTAVRVCTATTPACDAELCVAGGPFTECVTESGDQPCPPGPYSHKHLVGDAPVVTCGPCTCALTATCKGSIGYFTDTGCTMNALDLPVDGTCVSVNESGTSYHSYQYTGSVDTMTCKVPPTAPAMADVSNKRTMCCR